LNKRLASISASFNGTPVHTYNFDYGEYAPVTGVSRLKVVTLKDKSGASVLPLTFNWSDCATAVFDQSVRLNSLPAIMSDIRVLPVDVTGSGRMDVILACKQNTSDVPLLYLDVHLADGQGNITKTPYFSGSTGLTYPDQLLTVDVNGDGKIDLVRDNN
jgi:hypothetical protein